ncbi:hypothetical protein BGZ73_006713 [Actinomortierella ambigua]|nr:hypothetical protein BGZ73_006713 [Actinomortierella ambigua]
MPFVHNVSQSLGSEPPLEWATWPAGREPALNVDINPDSEASMSSTVSDASSIASSTVASDAAGSSGQEDLDGDPAFDARKQHPGRRASYEHPHEHHRHHHRQHQPGHEDAPSAYDADEDFSGSDYSTSSCESCSRRYSPSRGNSAEFSDGQHREAPYLKQPPPPQQKRQNRSTTHQAQYHWQAPKASRPSSPDSASKPTTSTNSKPTSSLGSLPSPSQASKMVLEFVLVGALMFTIVSAAFTFSYVVTATNHAGQKLREAIEARERSVQRALERVAGEDFVKVRRQQQQRQHHYHHGTTQKQPGVVEDDRLSPAEWQELIHAAVYGLLSKWAGQGVAR